MGFERLHRLRTSHSMRALLSETRLDIQDFIYPLFIKHTPGRASVASMPGIYQLGVKEVLAECESALELGIKSVLLFGVLESSQKDALGSHALSEDHIVAKATRAIKERFPSLVISVDLCFCEYTSHGHCGVLRDGAIDNDATLLNLSKQAVILASSGADIIAPSAMMDGMVSAIRHSLDSAGFIKTAIMSYSTKFASAYYGPFRDIAGSSPSGDSPSDRLSYQQNYANKKEAILESMIDDSEGADILMVKPALAYLDVVSEIRKVTLRPLAVYNVSGEYAMLKIGARHGLFDYEKMLLENMTAFKRAGADIIISYHAKELAKILGS